MVALPKKKKKKEIIHAYTLNEFTYEESANLFQCRKLKGRIEKSK